MAGLCEGDNEPEGSLKAIFNVNEIGDSEMVFGEMKPRIRNRLPCIHITFGENLGKNPNSVDGIGDNEMSREFAIDYLTFALRLGKTSEKTQSGNQPKRKSNHARTQLRIGRQAPSRQSYAGG
ncbi:hypothetical protein ANN_18266 [Periplaneta americana]|uniref:Uncharacterized protein n=1 Tax=Periplaneta americana TaxID=6978 RepID=A0ABQ8SPJ5_PERAM|nr:hypothetical protein ANN_18266 [Periplaneta americana]